MRSKFERLRNDVVGRRRVLEHLREELAAAEQRLEDAGRRVELAGQAAQIIRDVARATQEQFAFRVADLVTAAFDAIFPDPYRFGVEFVEKRGTIEAEFYLERGGNRFDPLSAAGGGVVDVAAMVLRVAIWSLASPQRRNVLILDEPLRFLSSDLQAAASELMSRIAHELGLQFIMVSHEEEIIARADRVFRVRYVSGKSIVELEEVSG